MWYKRMLHAIELKRAIFLSRTKSRGRLRNHPGCMTVVALVAMMLFWAPLLTITERFSSAAGIGSCVAAEKPAYETKRGANASRKSTSKSSARMTNLNQKYMGKDYIDSTIIRAIFIISDAASVAGVGFKQKEGIKEARLIARRLRLESKGDPNERYAEWKIRELEWLLSLEEKDLILQKMKENEADVNKLIADYNTEVAKARPDFKALFHFQSRMAELNPDRADEMAIFVNRRREAIAREAIAAVEKALLANNEPLASEEFRYCLRNRPYFRYPAYKFEEVEARVSACARSREELPIVKSEIEKANSLLDRSRVGEARNQIAFAEYRLSDIKPFVQAREVADLNVRIDHCDLKLDKVEDSLVAVNLAILERQGVDAANKYLQDILRESGVSRHKTAHVDQAILAVASAEKSNNKMQREIEAVGNTGDEKDEDVMTDMRAKAMIKAQRRLDSLAALGKSE